MGWDLYNEPGNNHLGERSLPLLQAVFAWARAAEPEQPLTAGTWYSSPVPVNTSPNNPMVDNWSFDDPVIENPALTDFSLSSSDILSFHNYRATEAELREQIARLKGLGRPVMCTEYMARRKTGGSPFARYLPVFKEERVAAFSWGLVSGKTQTIYPWKSLPSHRGNEPEPNPWFHDIFRSDGTPFDASEIEFIHNLTRG